MRIDFITTIVSEDDPNLEELNAVARRFNVALGEERFEVYTFQPTQDGKVRIVFLAGELDLTRLWTWLSDVGRIGKVEQGRIGVFVEALPEPDLIIETR